MLYTRFGRMDSGHASRSMCKNFTTSTTICEFHVSRYIFCGKLPYMIGTAVEISMFRLTTGRHFGILIITGFVILRVR